MKPYRSIFTEAVKSLNVALESEALQIVNISNLVWQDMGEMSWDKAITSVPSGWRLPTIQQLWTAYIQKVEGFDNDSYWSSSSFTNRPKEYAWLINFDIGVVDIELKSGKYRVCCVKDSNKRSKKVSKSLNVSSELEAKQLMDISNLVWSKNMGEMSWDQSMKKASRGWRLPTVQELYTAYVQGVKGFTNDVYRSSSDVSSDPEEFAWCVDFKEGHVIDFYDKSMLYNIRYVKEN